MTPTTRLNRVQQTRIASLTGFRFVAALLVLFCHLGISLAPRLPQTGLAAFNPYFYQFGAVGVSFFFILSGFILTWVATPGERAVLFWRRRIVKIYPVHAVTMVAAVVLMLTAGIAVTDANTLPALLLVQTWLPVQEVVLNYGSNSPAWSLACEAFFYLLFPLLYAVLRRVRPQRLWLWAGAVVAAIFAVPFVAQLLPATPLMPLSTDPWLPYWFAYYFPVTRLLEFVLGIVTALLVLNGQWIRVRPALAILLAVAAFVIGGSVPAIFGSVAPTAAPLALMIGAFAAAETRAPSRFLGSRVMVWLGEISFAFYMVHFLVVSYGPLGAANLANWSLPLSVSAAIGNAVATFVISVVLAWLLHLLVERPMMRRFSRPAAARKAPSAQGIPETADTPQTPLSDSDDVAAGRPPALVQSW